MKQSLHKLLAILGAMGASLLICAATSWAQTTVDLHEVDVRFTMAFETESYGRPVIRQTTLTARNIIQGADPDAPSNAILVLAANCDEGALGIFVYDPNEGALRAQVLESTDYQLTLVAGTRATVYSLMQVVESGILLDGVVSFQGTATLREGTCLQSARATFNGVLGVYDEASDSVQGAIITRGSITTKRYIGRITIE